MGKLDSDDRAIAAAKALAQTIARSFGVRARAGGSGGIEGWPATYFDMKAKHGQLPIEVEVFDGGCNLTGPVGGRPLPFALNNPIPGLGARGQAVAGLDIEVFCQHPGDLDRVSTFLSDPARRSAVSKLALSSDELFAVGTDRFYLLHQSHDVRTLHERLDLIAQLIPAPRQLRLVTKTAHGIKIGKAIDAGSKAPARHSWGGTLEQPPTCRNCNAAAHLLLTIDPTDRALDLKALGRDPLRVVFCLDCMSFPSLTYVDYSSAHPRVVQQDQGERHSETPPLEARQIQLTRQKSATGSGSRIGGSPKWLQDPEIPDCVSCGEPMAFLAQIASTRALSFVDDGMVYAFVCAQCRMMASFVQSH
jgi:hypothetical protein